jgi:hypothetical protein
VSNVVAVLDACVLYRESLRNLLIRLAVSGLYRARWTERIHQEWIAALLRQRPDIPRTALDWTREQLDSAVPDCLVTGYQHLENGLQLPDPDDRHVFAAAIRCHAGTIVTYNLKDFPDAALAPHGITAQHPDTFIEHAFGIDPSAVIMAVRNHRASLKNPPRTTEELFDSYLRHELAATVALLRPHAALL